MYSLTIKSKGDINKFYEALKLEAAKGNRFDLQIKKEKDGIAIALTAKDAVALKAIATSMIKLLEIAEKIGKLK